MHPVLSISFDDEGEFSVAIAEAARSVVENPGFEDGDRGWKASPGVIEIAGYPQAARGDGKAVLGRLGRRGETFLHQNVAIPASTSEATLTYRLRVSTGEPGASRREVDKMFVQIRTGGGAYLETLTKHSNLDKSRKYKTYELDLTKYKSRTIRLHFKSLEDADTATSFYLDDIEVRVK